MVEFWNLKMWSPGGALEMSDFDFIYQCTQAHYGWFLWPSLMLWIFNVQYDMVTTTTVIWRCFVWVSAVKFRKIDIRHSIVVEQTFSISNLFVLTPAHCTILCIREREIQLIHFTFLSKTNRSKTTVDRSKKNIYQLLNLTNLWINTKTGNRIDRTVWGW